jgi:23S rRNA pseudouridine2605 synthase
MRVSLRKKTQTTRYKNMNQKPEKLQKILAQTGIASRRQIEKMIADGRIEVNGKPAHLGQRITYRAKIVVDGKPIELPNKTNTRVILYNKPIGEICSRDDPEGRPTVFDHLPKITEGRWINIGRLDINTSGLMLFTNDGELANRLMHPSSQIEREYLVRVLGEVDEDLLKRLTRGVKLEDGLARFEHIVRGGGRGANQWLYVVVVAGRNRLVRRLFESQDLKVNRLKRMRFGSILLPDNLRQGRWCELNAHEINKL